MSALVDCRLKMLMMKKYVARSFVSKKRFKWLNVKVIFQHKS